MTRKSKARYGLARTYKINPAVNALRRALLAGLVAVSSTAIAAPPDYTVALDARYAGDVLIENVDDLAAVAKSFAAGVLAVSDYGYVAVSNSGNLDAFTYGGDYSYAIGLAAVSYTQFADVSNYGDITVSSTSGTGGAHAQGIVVYAADAVSIVNDAAINVAADVTYALSADAVAEAIGLRAVSIDGDVYISNAGDISTSAALANAMLAGGSYAAAIGVDASAYGAISLRNEGTITVQANNSMYYGAASAIGISTVAGGNVSLVNNGDIQLSGSAGGGEYYYGYYSRVAGVFEATGIYARGNGINVSNSGDITIRDADYASAIHARTYYGAVSIDNSGALAVDSGTVALGLQALAMDSVRVINNGDISVSADDFKQIYSWYYGDYYYVGGTAIGISGFSFINFTHVNNSGDIHAVGAVNAYGIDASSSSGNALLINSGDVEVVGQRDRAYGLIVEGPSVTQYLYGGAAYTQLDNSGNIHVSGYNRAVGAMARQYFGDLIVQNSGDLTVSADAEGGLAVGVVALGSLGALDLSNSGAISVVSNGSGWGVFTRQNYNSTYLYNRGAITVQATGEALGIRARSYGYEGAYYSYPADMAISSSGDISVISNAGRATGISASSIVGRVSLDVSGAMTVSGAERSAGIAAQSQYGDVLVYSDADMSVSSSAEYAQGIFALSVYGDVRVVNTGAIQVSGSSLTQGIFASNYNGAVMVVNAGDIHVDSSGYANAIAVHSADSAFVVNYGSLDALGADAWTVNAVGGALELRNYGSIHGSIIADGGDDVIYNASYYGYVGSIYMDDSSILLGGGTNTFINYGELFVNGSSNLIDMGGPGSTLYNYGSSIHMDDGAADDALTIIGDFAGTGTIAVDVDGQSLSSDRLYIEGDVLPDTANTVDVTLLSLPDAADLVAGATIPVVTVSGTSDPDHFVLGEVQSLGSALFTVDYALVQETSAGDFALAFDVTGLSTTGTVLSSLSPALQNLWYDSVGTLYQRQGGERRFSPDGKVEVSGASGSWVRVYGSDGALSPRAIRDNFGSAGNQNFDFSNHGVEFGFGYSFNSAWTAGILGGIVQGDVKPDVGGRARLDANTWGAYVSYTPSNGFYADLSYRDLDVDTTAVADGDSLLGKGTARGYTLETGYGMKTASGLEIEPQVQYSDMQVRLNEVAYGSGDFSLENGDSGRVRAGLALRKPYEQDAGVWTPYGSVSYVHGLDSNNRYRIGGALQGGVDTSGDSVLLELGTDAKYGNLVFNAGVGVQDGGAYDFVLSGQLNVRYTW